MPELITHTRKDYQDKAIELANNKSLLNEIRNKLNKKRLQTNTDRIAKTISLFCF